MFVQLQDVTAVHDAICNHSRLHVSSYGALFWYVECTVMCIARVKARSICQSPKVWHNVPAVC